MKKTREQSMTELAKTISETINTFGRRNDIIVKYGTFTEEQINTEFSELMRLFHHILSGNEYFLVYETGKPVSELPDDYKPNQKSLLYAVNVSGDSNITAAAELFDLASRKSL